MNRSSPFTHLIGAVGTAFLLMMATSAGATPVSAELFYTTYAGGTNVHKVKLDYDGTTVTLSGNTGIAAVAGADGIAGNPNDPDSLFIGGQGYSIHRLKKDGTLLQTLATKTPVYHLEVADNSTLYGTGIPSSQYFDRVTINPDGSLAINTTLMKITGGGFQVTQIITTPSGNYFTASAPRGYGSFGKVNIVGNTAILTPINGTYPAAHGGVYDPFSKNIILFGDGHITQVDLNGNIVADIGGFSGPLDQGTVDGLGHIYAARNNGYFTFIDYTATGFIDSGFQYTQFLAPSLDDIAPLVGAGGTGGGGGGSVPEPATLLLMGMGLAGLGLRRRRGASS